MRFAQRARAERARLRIACGDGALNLVRRAEEEIHIGRLNLCTVVLFQVSVAARFGVLDVVGVVRVSDDLIGAHLVRALRDNGAAVERDAMLFLFE